MNESIFSQQDYQVVLSFNKHTTSLASSTCTLIPRSRSQVILTSFYLAKKVTRFKDLSESGLWSPNPAPATPPLQSVLYNQLFTSSRASNELCYLTSQPFTVLSGKFHAFSSQVSVRISFSLVSLSFQDYPSLSTSPTQDFQVSSSLVPLPHFCISGCSFSVSYANLSTLGGQQLCFCLAPPRVFLLLRAMLGTQLGLRKQLLNK